MTANVCSFCFCFIFLSLSLQCCCGNVVVNILISNDDEAHDLILEEGDVFEQKLYNLCHQNNCSDSTFYFYLQDIRKQLSKASLLSNDGYVVAKNGVNSMHVEPDLMYEDCHTPHTIVNDYCESKGFSNAKDCKYVRDQVYNYCKIFFKTIPFLEMPSLALGLGGAHYIASGNYRLDTLNVNSVTVDQIYESLKMGIRHIDTAEMYGNDYELKQALNRFYDSTSYRREDVWITTKIYGNMANPIKGCREIIERIGCDYLDLVLLHYPIRMLSDAIPIGNKTIGMVWEELQILVSVGLVRYIGVSNFGVPELQELFSLDTLAVPPFLNQVEYSIYLQQRDLHDYCLLHGVKLAAFGTLSPLKRFKHGPADDLLVALAAKYSTLLGVSVAPSAILMRHAQQKLYIPIVTASNALRMTEYVPVVPDEFGRCLFALSPEDVDALDRSGQYRHQRFYLRNHFPHESDVMEVVVDDGIHYLGPHPDYVNQELQRFVDYHGAPSSLNILAINYYDIYYRDPAPSNPIVEEMLHTQLNKNGYFIIPNLLSRDQCLEIRASVLKYISSNKMCSQRKGDANHYIADIRRNEDLKYVFAAVNGSPKLRVSLLEAFNVSEGNSIEFNYRNEILVDRTPGWHRDNIEDIYIEDVPPRDEWSTDEDTGDRFKTVNVALYLQDHSDTASAYTGLTVAKGSHVCSRCHGPHVKLAIKAGDAVVFDSRLRHKGAWNLENMEGNRIMLSFGYGIANNTFSNAYKTSLLHRNAIYTNSSICNCDYKNFACIKQYMIPFRSVK